jgi:hypothetical protein
VLRKMILLAAIAAVVLSSSAATALGASRSANNPAKGSFGKNKDLAGLVDIGGDRKMYLECHGKGSPTVVFVSGFRGAHDDWTHVIDSGGEPKPSGSAVFSERSGRGLPQGGRPRTVPSAQTGPVLADPSANRPRLSEEFAIANLPSNRVVLDPPGFFPRTSRWGGKHELLPGPRRLLLSYPEMVVVEDAQRLDHIGDRDPAVADEKQVLPVLRVCRRGEVVGAEVDPGSRFVEIDDDELVVHAVATASCGLRFERLRDVLPE